jgi:hypothetical protein
MGCAGIHCPDAWAVDIEELFVRDTIELCKTVGFPLMSFEGVTYVSPELERLVALVRADEREACAALAEKLEWADNKGVASAIQARGQA